MSLGVNIDRAVRHGLELVCVQIVSDSKQYTPIHTGALRNTTQYRMKGNLKAEIETGGGLDYAEKQYNKKDGKQLRHMGSFADGLQSIVSQYAGSLETGMTAKARYWGAWRLPSVAVSAPGAASSMAPPCRGSRLAAVPVETRAPIFAPDRNFCS